MKNYADLITIFFFAVLLVLCIFVIVHTTMQIKNNSYNTFGTSPVESKKNKKKLIKIVIVGLLLSCGIFYKLMNNVSSYNATEDMIDSYKDTIIELDIALSLDFKNYKKGTYSSAEKVAKFINSKLPVKDLLYVKTTDNIYKEFLASDIYKFNLNDFVNNPTLVTYDKILMSIIKFKDGCKYVNKAFLGTSDCLIEIDVNHFDKPNQIGQDRTLFAIDGKNNRIIADVNFFGK